MFDDKNLIEEYENIVNKCCVLINVFFEFIVICEKWTKKTSEQKCLKMRKKFPEKLILSIASCFTHYEDKKSQKNYGL